MYLKKNLMLIRNCIIIGVRVKRDLSKLFYYLVFRDFKQYVLILKFKNWIKIYIYIFILILWVIFINDIVYLRLVGVIYFDI